MNRLCLIIAILFILINKVLSQTEQVSGIVKDGDFHPLSYANIVLLSKIDSSFISGTTTDTLGCFSLSVSDKDQVWMRVSLVGYRTEIIMEPTSEMSVILKSLSYEIGEVVVRGQHNIFKMKGSSLVVDVGNSILKTLGNANDVLKQLPGVIGDNGNFSLFGKGSAIVYINDRQLRDASELRRLNSEDIVSVEIIRNPGALYDVEARAVLKIKTKKKLEGLSSQLYVGGAQGRRFSNFEQLNVSYTTAKTYLYGSFSGSDNRSNTDMTSFTRIHADQLYQLRSEMMEWDQDSHFYNFETGLNYDWSPKHSFGTSYSYQHNIYESDGGDYETISGPSSMIDEFYNSNTSKNVYNQHSLNAFYIGYFTDRLMGRLDMDYIKRLGDDKGVVHEMDSGRMVTSINALSYDLYAGNLVLSYAVGSGKISAGTDFSFVKRDQDYYNVENILPESRVKSTETKIAGFLNCEMNIQKVNIKGGLRYEYYHPLQKSKDGVSLVDKVYRELYPDMSFSFPFKKSNISLLYTCRTKRPTFYQLSNTIEYNSRFLYSQGNPFLVSPKIHDLSLDYSYDNYLFFSIGYQNVRDQIASNQQLQEGNPVKIVSTPINYNRYQLLNASVFFQKRIAFWNPSYQVGVSKPIFSIENYLNDKVKLNKARFYLNFTNYFYLPLDFILAVNARCMTGGNETVEYVKPTYTLDLGFYKYFCKDKLRLTLQIGDVFASNKKSFIRYSKYTENEQWRYFDSRVVSLSLTYIFNQYKSKYKGVSSASSEKRRM